MAEPCRLEPLRRSDQPSAGTLDHDVPADLVEIVAQTVGKPPAGRVEQQPRRLDRIPGDGNRPGGLVVLDAVVDVRHPSTRPPVSISTARTIEVGPDLGTVGEGVGNVGDEWRRFGVDLAALYAKPAVDTVRSIAEAPVADGDRPDAHIDIEVLAALHESHPVASDRMGRLWVPVRLAPGPVLSRHRQFLFHVPVVGTQLFVANRPISPHPVVRRGGEVGRVESGRIAGVVDHRPADTGPELFEPRGTGRAGDDPGLGPVEVVRS